MAIPTPPDAHFLETCAEALRALSGPLFTSSFSCPAKQSRPGCGLDAEIDPGFWDSCRRLSSTVVDILGVSVTL